MTSTTPGFVGRRLVEARQARCMSATALAEIVGVSVQSISKYENDHQSPQLEVLHKLAAALNMPRAYFLRAARDGDAAPIYWRARLSAPPTMLSRASVRLEWMKEIVDYLAQFFDLRRPNLPELEMPIDTYTVADIEAAAEAIRKHWGIRPDVPMPDVIEKLEANGVLVSRIHVHVEKMDAFSQWSKRAELPFVILGRDKASAVRQRFDALHELCHLIAHKNLPTKRLNDRAYYKAVEKQADRLACALLLPSKGFIDELYAPTLDAFKALKERWGVSIAAMVMRCQYLDLIDDDEARRMWINYTRRGWREGEPLDNKLPKEAPFMIRQSFEKLISEKVQSVSDILSALPFPPDDLEELTDLEPGTLTGKVETRAEPIFKQEFRNDPPNVVSIFGNGKKPN